MARQSGVIQISGTVGGVVFAKDGTVRQKQGSNKSQFNSSASMQRVRENASEFGTAAKAGKLVRDALRRVVVLASDRLMVSRLAQKMKEILNLDEDSDRGGRQILPENLPALLGFDFNAGSSFSGTYYGGVEATLDRATGTHTVNLGELNPSRDVAAPQGATHYRITAAVGSINFETGAVASAEASTVELPLSNAVRPAEALQLVRAAAADESLIVAVGVDFFQQLNGKFYPLNSNAYNALSVVAIG
ncbi:MULTISPECIES: hypothetical protein [Hymenobacter]|jgi:hypothetical protein|uniref:Uncharacterized protein n=2 Tax=Hymenobacter TaxID=89966 RepID=A0A1M6USN6_9BACT|nr:MULTISPECIES: hypothetical protein [Hymenobacter]MBG8554023.1 hypothetical protein [Hymenobacter guriensis]SHK72193.1 hypothetical protein SAMN02746009_01463 [Hymenobacter psychrotolerans DSM 18569]